MAVRTAAYCVLCNENIFVCWCGVGWWFARCWGWNADRRCRSHRITSRPVEFAKKTPQKRYAAVRLSRPRSGVLRTLRSERTLVVVGTIARVYGVGVIGAIAGESRQFSTQTLKLFRHDHHHHHPLPILLIFLTGRIRRSTTRVFLCSQRLKSCGCHR